ncbi:MAG: hypothetical protein QOH44_1485 [Actinomycetota bacterium]|nr:hypothetical protein [Actinomycetota bacterium]
MPSGPPVSRSVIVDIGGTLQPKIRPAVHVEPVLVVEDTRGRVDAALIETAGQIDPWLWPSTSRTCSAKQVPITGFILLWSNSIPSFTRAILQKAAANDIDTPRITRSSQLSPNPTRHLFASRKAIAAGAQYAIGWQIAAADDRLWPNYEMSGDSRCVNMSSECPW